MKGVRAYPNSHVGQAFQPDRSQAKSLTYPFSDSLLDPRMAFVLNPHNFTTLSPTIMTSHDTTTNSLAIQRRRGRGVATLVIRRRKYQPATFAPLALLVIGGLIFPPAGLAAEAKLDFVTVMSDAGAGGYEAFPDVCRLKDGRLMCVCYASFDHVGLPNPNWPKGGRIASSFSSDEGRTWSKPETLFDGPDDDRDPSITQLKDGRLLCSFFTLHRKESADKPLGPISMDSFTLEGSWLTTSDDGGKTWSAPARLADAPYLSSSPIRELSNGRLIGGLYCEAGGKANGAVIYSDDGGRNWSKVIDLDNRGLYLDAETDLIELENGHLLAAQRSSKSPFLWATSLDNGTTWSPSQPADFQAHCPYLHRTADGDIVLGVREIKQDGGAVAMYTALRVSRDNGKTWSDAMKIDDCVGAYPSMVNLKDGSVLIVYYEEGAGSSIRARRFRVTPMGVEFLPLSKENAEGQN